MLPPIFCKGNHDNSYGCPALTASSNGRIWGFHSQNAGSNPAVVIYYYKKGGVLVAQATATRKRGRPKKTEELAETPSPCIRCGKQYKRYVGNFYKNSRSEAFVQNDSRIPICANCLTELQQSLERKYRDKRVVFMALCAYCDVYYCDKAYYDVINSGNGDFGRYCRIINSQQYKNRTFQDTIAEMNDKIIELSTPADAPTVRNLNEQDKQNLTYVVSAIGYDCFDDDSWTDEDRRFAFNTLADYLTDDVLEDSHKVQSVITMVKTYVQIEQIDRILNTEMRKTNIDAEQINKLSNVKKGLLSAINSMAKENGISAITSGKKTQGGNSLTRIMREMAENNFEEIKVNVIDSKLSESYKEVATDNIKAIINELHLTSDEYAEMLSQQTELVAKQQEKIDKYEEDKRLLRIEIKGLKEEIEKLDARRKGKK